jgi:hypothetical protein
MHATDGEPVGKSCPVDLAFVEDRPFWVKRSLLSPANVNRSVATAQPRPRFRRIGQVATRSVLSGGSDQGYG